MYNYLRISIIGLITLFFVSCKKDLVDLPIPKVASIQETLNFSMSSSVPVTTNYNFQYDQQGRVSAVNNRRFVYGSNGKVAYSEVRNLSTHDQGMTYEYVERLRFEWDDNGRLASIVADSIFHHQYTKIGGEVRTQFKSFATSWVIARYKYEGSSRLPSSISHIINFEQVGQSPITETVDLEYEGENVVRMHQFSQLILPPNAGGPIGYPVLTLHTWQRHTDRPHYLYPIYKQLGFHPFNFGAVVSAKGQNAIYSVVQTNSTPPLEADWPQAEKFEIQYSEKGGPKQLRSARRTITVNYN